MRMNEADEKAIRSLLYSKMRHALLKYDEDLELFHDCILSSIDVNMINFSIYYIKTGGIRVGIAGVYDLNTHEIRKINSNVKLHLSRLIPLLSSVITSCLVRLSDLERTYCAIWLHSSEFNEREDKSQYICNDYITRVNPIDVKGNTQFAGVVLVRNFVWKGIKEDFKYGLYSDARKKLIDFNVGNPMLSSNKEYFNDLYNNKVMSCILDRQTEINNLVFSKVVGNFFKLDLRSLPKTALRNDKISKVPFNKVKSEILNACENPKLWESIDKNATVVVNYNRNRLVSCCVISRDSFVEVLESFERGKHHAYNILQYLLNEGYISVSGYSKDSSLSFWHHLGSSFYKNIEDIISK